MKFKAKDQYTPGLLMSSIVFSFIFFIPFHFVQNHYHFQDLRILLVSIFLVAISSGLSFMVYQIILGMLMGEDTGEDTIGGASAGGFDDISQDSISCPEITATSLGITLLTTVILFFCFVFLI